MCRNNVNTMFISKQCPANSLLLQLHLTQVLTSAVTVHELAPPLGLNGSSIHHGGLSVFTKKLYKQFDG